MSLSKPVISRPAVVGTSPASVYNFEKYTLTYYLKGALAGGLCCGVTHGSLCPVDVVKTRMQLSPEIYNDGMIGGFRKVIASEGVGALSTGLVETCVGYFIQGGFKFGGVELFKVSFTKSLGDQKAWDNKTAIYLASAAMAEFIADVFLCPLEACRIRLVSEPTFANSLPATAARLVKENGVIGGFYSGFVPMLFKQVPYTMAKFAVQGAAADAIAAATKVDLVNGPGSSKMGVALSSGIIAGVVAAVISHPADSLLSKVNKKGAGGSGGMMSRLANITKETGIMTLCTQGLGARCVMIGTLTAGQFAIFDSVMDVLGASKFHFHAPGGHH
jgi:solute carrier family 25 phosphate transporter 3